MTKNNQRKVVMLRGVKSNIIEEAILILRNEEYMNSNDEKIAEKRNFILMQEAYSIIDNYKDEKSETININIKKTKKPSLLSKIKKTLFSPFGLFFIVTIIYLLYRGGF